jgi:hypothetical protein
VKSQLSGLAGPLFFNTLQLLNVEFEDVTQFRLAKLFVLKGEVYSGYYGRVQLANSVCCHDQDTIVVVHHPQEDYLE